MINRIINKIARTFENVQFKIFSNVLKKYNVEFYYKDKLNILTKRKYDDNFNYIFKTHNSCDAIPTMENITKIYNGDNQLAFDVGANIGITTTWLAKILDFEKVIAFEPDISNLERLKETLNANKVNNVLIEPLGISNKSGIANFYVHHSLEIKHLSKEVNTKKITVISLDEYCQNNNIEKIDILKVDVEGHEDKVFEGAKKLLKIKNIKFIIFEHSAILLEKQDKTGKSIIRLLEENNYDIYRMNGEKVTEYTIDTLEQEDLYAI